jgi:hypothetical protein
MLSESESLSAALKDGLIDRSGRPMAQRLTEAVVD